MISFNEKDIAELHELLGKLVSIPAPSHNEGARAEFCKRWLTECGAEGVYIDEALNCIYPINCEGNNDITVFMAHTDTVFPDTTPFEMKDDGERFLAPGVGDDTASLAIMLIVTKRIIEEGFKAKHGVLIVANSCEEGLGNLKGSKQIVKDFGSVLREFYTLDGKFGGMATTCVGSHRYSITCESEGGHSFGTFGNTNAIAELARLVTELYGVEVPEKEGTKTTYNVGVIEGGTSVNTIAQNAKMLYEYRSDDRECLAAMQSTFEGIMERFKAESKAKFTVEVVGMRPCDGKVDETVRRAMIDKVKRISKKHNGLDVSERSGSTDCNSASSAGIPSVCLGVYMGGGTHTREEWIRKDSVLPGLKICAELVLSYFD